MFSLLFQLAIGISKIALMLKKSLLIRTFHRYTKNDQLNSYHKCLFLSINSFPKLKLKFTLSSHQIMKDAQNVKEKSKLNANIAKEVPKSTIHLERSCLKILIRNRA